jgi:hypothetical protein
VYLGEAVAGACEEHPADRGDGGEQQLHHGGENGAHRDDPPAVADEVRHDPGHHLSSPAQRQSAYEHHRETLCLAAAGVSTRCSGPTKGAP